MSSTNKPIILASDGIFTQLADGELINAGGTTSPTWVVNGRGLLFDDGTSTNPGSSVSPLSLQTIYNNSPAIGGQTGIKLTTGKDFVISDDTDNSVFFKIDAETGKVTITGDLEILGGSTIIETVIQDSDHWVISPKLGTTTALKIEPDFGVNPIVDLVSIRRTFAGLPVFRIDNAGNLIASQNLTVSGLINGVDLVALKSALDSHLAGDPGYRHLAADVDILPIATLPGANNVQEALQQINTKVDSGGTAVGDVVGYEHIQTTEDTLWVVSHNKYSNRAQVSVYDDNWEQIIPDTVKVIDNNTIFVYFSTPISGRAMVLLF